MTSAVLFARKAFTLAETLIAVAVISILLTLALPNFVTFYDFTAEQREQRNLLLIREGLNLFMNDQQRLPTAAEDWAELIAPYTPLPVDQMRFDEWDRPRYYRMVTSNVTIKSITVPVDYAVVYAYGPDGEIDQAVMDNNWLGTMEPTGAQSPLAALTNVASYNSVRGDETGDDNFIKTSTLFMRTAQVNESLRRIQGIYNALDTYRADLIARTKTALAPAALGYPVGTTMDSVSQTEIDIVNFSPESLSPTPDTAIYIGDATGAAFNPPFPAELDDEVTSFLGGATVRINNTTDDAARLVSMQRLINLLGLPPEFCCNAIDGRAFFYFSNPRPTDGTPCGTRPGATGLYLLPRVEVFVNANTCG